LDAKDTTVRNLAGIILSFIHEIYFMRFRIKNISIDYDTFPNFEQFQFGY